MDPFTKSLQNGFYFAKTENTYGKKSDLDFPSFVSSLSELSDVLKEAYKIYDTNLYLSYKQLLHDVMDGFIAPSCLEGEIFKNFSSDGIKSLEIKFGNTIISYDRKCIDGFTYELVSKVTQLEKIVNKYTL